MLSSEKAKQALAQELLGSVDKLASTPHSGKLVTQKLRGDTLLTLANVGKVIHGWGDGGDGSGVRIGTIRNAVIVTAAADDAAIAAAQAQAKLSAQSECIDVTPSNTSVVPPADSDR
jgi:plasmid stabilization system protein ParE